MAIGCLIGGAIVGTVAYFTSGAQIMNHEASLAEMHPMNLALSKNWPNVGKEKIFSWGYTHIESDKLCIQNNSPYKAFVKISHDRHLLVKESNEIENSMKIEGSGSYGVEVGGSFEKS